MASPRRFLACPLLLLFVLPAIASPKRRAVLPGVRECSYGVLAQPEYANRLALDATHVYYFDDFAETLFRVPKNGGAPTTLAELPALLVFDLIVDDTNVYLATIPASFDEVLLPGSILSVPKGGGAPVTIASGVNFPTQLVTDATAVYWVGLGTIHFDSGMIESNGKVERARKDGSGRQTLAEHLSTPTSIALDGEDLYFSELGAATGNPSQGVRRTPKGGGAIAHVQDDYAAADVIVSGSELIYAGGSTTASGLLRIPKSGGASTWIVQDDTMEGSPKLFGGQLYYASELDDEGYETGLMRVPATGGTAELISSTHMTDSDFEVDACGVYYGTYDETLVRAPR